MSAVVSCGGLFQLEVEKTVVDCFPMSAIVEALEADISEIINVDVEVALVELERQDVVDGDVGVGARGLRKYVRGSFTTEDMLPSVVPIIAAKRTPLRRAPKSEGSAPLIA